MAIYLIAYFFGAIVMMAIQSKVSLSKSVAQDKDREREYDMRVVVSVVAWPLVLPMMAILWVKSYIEDASYRKRHEEWRRKCGRP